MSGENLDEQVGADASPATPQVGAYTIDPRKLNSSVIKDFPSHLAKYYMSKGYEETVVPEAEKLSSECDILLTRNDGMNFSMILILDLKKRKGNGFQMSLEQLNGIGKVCLDKYSGSLNSTKMPIQIFIYEIGDDIKNDSDMERLSALKNGIFSKIQILAWRLDPSTGSITSNSSNFIKNYFGRRILVKMLTGPALTDEQLSRPDAAINENAGPPLLTYFMMAFLVGIFVLEQIFKVDSSPGGILAPGMASLYAMGASSHSFVVGNGEWYRLFTAVLLHADVTHILMNSIAFYFAGIVLEPLVGRAWMFTLFFIGGLGGELFSIFLNSPHMFSVGASGAIMGMMAAGYVLSFRLSYKAGKMRIQQRLMGVLIPSLLPFASHLHEHEKVDISAHLGGAVFGALAGWFIYKNWPRENPAPNFAAFSRSLAIIGAAVFLLAGISSVKNYAHVSQIVGVLIPAEKFPKTQEQLLLQSGDLVANYPHDPRGHWLRAEYFMGKNSASDAEKEFQLALNEKELLATMLPKVIELGLRTEFAILLSEENKMDEARAMAKPVCDDGTETKYLSQLQKVGLCR